MILLEICANCYPRLQATHRFRAQPWGHPGAKARRRHGFRAALAYHEIALSAWIEPVGGRCSPSQIRTA
jgi:hypothetical protein